VPKEYPLQFPFRHGLRHDDLPWSSSSPAKRAALAEHIIVGELGEADARAPVQFRVDGRRDCGLHALSEGAVKFLNAKARSRTSRRARAPLQHVPG